MRKWLPLVAVCLGTFMLLIDVTIVNVALPDMAVDLKTSFGSLQWVVDAYALTLAALVLGTGSIADRIGHRRAYVGGLVLFAVSSLVCGISPDASALVTARAVQGVGAAAMFATTFALLNASYSGRDRGTAYGLWGAVSGASAAVGPIVGGLLTEGISWRWIFFVNLPVSVVAIVMCLVVLTDAHPPVRRRVDVVGMAVFTAAAAAATYGLIRANEHGWSTDGAWGMLAAAVALGALFVLIEARSSQPMLELSLLRNRAFVGILVAGLLLTFGAFASFTYTSIWMQSVLGMSPIEAGLTGLPLSLASFVTSAALGRVLHKAAPGLLIGGGLLLIGAGGVVGGLLVHGSASWPALLPGFFVIGIGVGMATPTLSSTAMSAVPAQRGGMAAGAVNTARQLGFAFGIAALGSVFATRVQAALSARHVPDAARAAQAVAGGQSAVLLRTVPASVRSSLDGALHAAAVSGIQATLYVSAVAGLLAGVLVLWLVRDRPAQAPLDPLPGPRGRAESGPSGGSMRHRAASSARSHREVSGQSSITSRQTTRSTR